MRSRLAGAVLFLILAAPVFPARAQNNGASDDIVARIREEGLNNSLVMQTLSYLTDVIGPRLTGSPALKRANEWTRDRLASWGLQNAHLEAWGPFGRGWELERFSAQVVSPQDIPLIAFPKAWSPGLKKPLTADVVFVDANSMEDLKKYRGKLHGAIVLNGPPRDIAARFQPQGVRYTDEQLAAMQSATPGERPRFGGPGRQMTPEQRAQFMNRFQLAARKIQFFLDEGAALVVEPSTQGDDGTIFVQSASVPQPANGTGGEGERGRRGDGGTSPSGLTTPDSRLTTQPPRRVQPWDVDASKTVPQIVVSAEHYNRMVRMIRQGEHLKMAVDLDVKFFDKDRMAYNTIAEIPGSDLKDQIVMLGGHMDSWHSGTGATDNAAGDAVCMEAVRILEALHLQPRRTIRIALWTGEEEGLLGSRAYVASHFGTREGGSSPLSFLGGGSTAPDQPVKLNKKPEYEKLSAYFNLDNGTGKIRGIYLQGNEAARPIFTEWLAPFKDLGASTVTVNNTGGTDHQSFDAIGLPGFQFIQDPIEYESRTHHSNQDVFDRAQTDDLKEASVIMATFVYNAAMRDEMIPRKELR